MVLFIICKVGLLVVSRNLLIAVEVVLSVCFVFRALGVEVYIVFILLVFLLRELAIAYYILELAFI